MIPVLLFGDDFMQSSAHFVVCIGEGRLVDEYLLLGGIVVLQVHFHHLSHRPRLRKSFVIFLPSLLGTLQALNVILAAVAGNARVESWTQVGTRSVVQGAHRLRLLNGLFDLAFEILEFLFVI